MSATPKTEEREPLPLPMQNAPNLWDSLKVTAGAASVTFASLSEGEGTVCRCGNNKNSYSGSRLCAMCYRKILLKWAARICAREAAKPKYQR